MSTKEAVLAVLTFMVSTHILFRPKPDDPQDTWMSGVFNIGRSRILFTMKGRIAAMLIVTLAEVIAVKLLLG